MKTQPLSLHPIRLGLRLWLSVALMLSVIGSVLPAAAAAPLPKSAAIRSSAAPVAALPATNSCTTDGTTFSCQLYAMTGTLTLPDSTSVAIWGYSPDGVAAPGIPGPTLVVTQGLPVSITLHNVNLPSATSLSISQQPMVPDTSGVTAGSSKTYVFAATALQPGTYLYEAGLTPDGPRQAAMGLIGALIVRPSACATCAYDANSVFDDEALVVLSEVDPAFNAAPLTFDLSNFAPKYWLINGKGYPNTDVIPTLAGHRVLLRYVNAGLVHHSMSLLGLHESLIAVDGNPETNPARVTAQTIPTGSTLDAIATITTTAPAGTNYPLFEAAMHEDNNGASTGGMINFGGMLTFLQVAGGSVANGGPVTSNVAVAPTPTNGSVSVALSASVAAVTSTVMAAEYFIDTIGANGTGVAMSGAFGTGTVAVNATLSTAQLATLSSGHHTFYVHGQDSLGVWGATASAVLNLDKTGPTVSNFALTPARANGHADVQLQATASDAATGGQNVIAAEYSLDGGATTAIPIALPATDVSLNSTIISPTVVALSDGNHTISVRAQDSLLNWGAFVTTTLIIDKSGPATSAVTTVPNPTNGTFGVQGGSGGAFYQRVDASVSDPVVGGVRSAIVTAEYFVDTIGITGTGHAMFPTDGLFSSPTEAVYQLLDLFGIAALPQGQHTIYVHGQDAAGNWGAFGTTALIVDKTAPMLSGLSTAPAPANLATVITASVTAADPANTGTPANGPASNLVGGEYFWGTTDPGVGNGTAFPFAAPAASGTFAVPIDVSQRTIFTNNTLSVRVKDAATNWSSVLTTTISIDRLFASSFPTSTAPYGWSATGGTAARLSLNAAANMKDAGTNSLAANVATSTSGYVLNSLPAGQTSYRARFYLSPNGATLNTGNTPTVFAALNGTASVFSVQLRRNSGQYQVRVAGSANSNWYTITGATAIEVARSGTTLSLYTGGTLRQTVAVATTAINAARLGLSAGITTAMNGSTLYFDGFVSSRTTVIGP